MAKKETRIHKKKPVNKTSKHLNQVGKKVQISVLMSEYGITQQVIVTAMNNYLQTRYPDVFKLKIVHENSAEDAILDKLVTQEIESGVCKGLVSIGYSASHAVPRILSQKKSSIPSVLSAITSPVKDKLITSHKNSKNNCVAIATKTACHLVPAQLIAGVCRKFKSYIIPFRTKEIDTIQLTELEEFKRLMEIKGKQVTLYPISEERLPLNLFATIKQHQVLFIPEGSMHYRDRDSILGFCSTQGIESFADGFDAVNKGATWGVTSDMSIVGIKVAQKLVKIHIEGKKASELKSTTIDFARRLAFNRRGLRRFGVFFSKDLLYLFDLLMANNKPLSPEDFAKLYGLITFATNAADKNIIGYLINKISNCIIARGGTPPPRGTQYTDIIPLEGRDLDTEITEVIEDKSVHQIHAGGRIVLGQLFSKMDRKHIRNRKAVFSMQYVFSLKDAIGVHKDRPDNSLHHATLISPVHPGRMLRTLKKNSARTDKIITLVEKLTHQDHHFLSIYKNITHLEAEECKVTATVTTPLSLDEMKHLINKNAKGGRTHFILSHHFLSKKAMCELAQHCNETQTLFFALGENMSASAPLGGYLDAEAITLELPFSTVMKNVKIRYITDNAYTYYRNKTLLKQCKGHQIRDHVFDVTLEDIE